MPKCPEYNFEKCVRSNFTNDSECAYVADADKSGIIPMCPAWPGEEQKESAQTFADR